MLFYLYAIYLLAAGADHHGVFKHGWGGFYVGAERELVKYGSRLPVNKVHIARGVGLYEVAGGGVVIYHNGG